MSRFVRAAVQAARTVRTATLRAGIAALAYVILPAPAHALNQVSFLSATGTAGNCSRATPCFTLNSAVINTVNGGTIVCLDSGEFGDAIITNTLTIDCTGTASSMRMQINGIGNNVTVRNVRFELDDWIDFLSGSSVTVENCLFTTSQRGILFRPNGPARLAVTDSVFTSIGNGTTGGAIVVNPIGGGTARVAINRVTLEGNVFGIAADGTGSTGGINMTISDSMISGSSQDGIIAVTPGGGAPIGVLVTNSRSLNNSIGIRSIGPNVTVRVKNSEIAGNGTGLSFGAGGALLSFGNNAVQANGANGAFSGSVGLQ